MRGHLSHLQAALLWSRNTLLLSCNTLLWFHNTLLWSCNTLLWSRNTLLPFNVFCLFDAVKAFWNIASHETALEVY